MTLSDLLKGSGRVLRDVFTGADNQTTAIGRIAAVPYLTVALYLPFYLAHKDQAVSLAEAGTYMVAAAGGFAALVWGTHRTEPSA